MAVITGDDFTYVVPADPVKYAELRREKEARRDELRSKWFKNGDERAELRSLEKMCDILADSDPSKWLGVPSTPTT